MGNQSVPNTDTGSTEALPWSLRTFMCGGQRRVLASGLKLCGQALNQQSAGTAPLLAEANKLLLLHLEGLVHLRQKQWWQSLGFLEPLFTQGPHFCLDLQPQGQQILLCAEVHTHAANGLRDLTLLHDLLDPGLQGCVVSNTKCCKDAVEALRCLGQDIVSHFPRQRALKFLSNRETRNSITVCSHKLAHTYEEQPCLFDALKPKNCFEATSSHPLSTPLCHQTGLLQLALQFRQPLATNLQDCAPGMLQQLWECAACKALEPRPTSRCPQGHFGQSRQTLLHF